MLSAPISHCEGYPEFRGRVEYVPSNVSVWHAFKYLQL